MVTAIQGNRAFAIVVALFPLLPFSVSTKASPPGQVGLVFLKPDSPASGGQLSYQFNVDAFEPGTLLVKAKVTGKKWKATFPDLTATLPEGLTPIVNGTSVSIPTNFTGDAVLKFKIKLNGKKLDSRQIPFTVSAAPPPGQTTFTTNLYDVGFENDVMLDGSFVPTSDLGGTLTYAWTQTTGKTVALSANDVQSPSFTTDALTNFVRLGTAIFFTDVDEDGVTNQVYVTREDRFATNNCNSIAISAEDAAAATYDFQVLVSNGSVTRTGLIAVACATQTPAQPNTPVGVPAFYRGATNSMDWSLINKPAGSAATLKHANGLIPELRPDVEGIYVVHDNVTGFSVTNVAANYTGYQFCNICHGPNSGVGQEDKVSIWSQTRHASFFQRAIDGQVSAEYNESCIACHTVGYNKAPAANNSGFDDVARDLGWKFPSVIQPGNFAALPDQLKNQANIQCESCHGPGSQHPGSPSVSTDLRVCGQCHQDGVNYLKPQQWETGPHSGGYENISTSRGVRQDCARCHSPVAYIAIAKGHVDFSTGTNSVPTGIGALTCQACHNPHDKYGDDSRHQLRVFDAALFGNPYFRSNTVTIARGQTVTSDDPRLTNSNLVVTDLANEATCVSCHNGRQLPTQVQVYGSSAGKMFYQTGGPHDQTAGEAFLGVGMYDYGIAMGNSYHTTGATCQKCHMYKLRAPSVEIPQDTILIDDVETPVTQDVYDQYANLLGGHTFSMSHSGASKVDNLAACSQCHGSSVHSFDFVKSSVKDFDGNGVAEGVQTETRGLLANLTYLLMYGTDGVGGVLPTTNATTGIPVFLSVISGTNAPVVVVTNDAPLYVTGFSTTSTYYSKTNAIKEAQRKAVWNWLASYREGSFGVHNTQYTTKLLQSTYTDLSTNFFDDVSRTYTNDYPNAVLR